MVPDEANYFRYEVLNVLEKEKRKEHVNVTEKQCNKIKKWLKENELTLIEADKGKATCIIEENKVDDLIKKELQKKERYTKIRRDPSAICRTQVNKKLNELAEKNMISEEEVKKMKTITPRLPQARPSLKAHKDPLKVRLIINTQGSATYKIAKEVAKELKPLTINGRSFVKNSAGFVNSISDITLEDSDNVASFDLEDMFPSPVARGSYRGSPTTNIKAQIQFKNTERSSYRIVPPLSAAYVLQDQRRNIRAKRWNIHWITNITSICRNIPTKN